MIQIQKDIYRKYYEYSLCSFRNISVAFWVKFKEKENCVGEYNRTKVNNKNKY